MARPPKTPNYLICYADQLGSVSKDRIYVEDSEPSDSLLDEIDWHPADSILIALRRCFSLTFSKDYSLKGRRKTVAQIRHAGVGPLQAIPKVLADLRLQPVPVDPENSDADKVQVFKFALVRESLLPAKVSHEGKKRRFLDILQYELANPLILALRSVLGDTFTEAFDEEQHDSILTSVRRRIWQVLPAYNVCLDSIEIEPIAEYRSDEEERLAKTEK